MKGKRAIRGTGLLFLVAVFCFVSVEASGAELQPVQVELVSSQPSYTGSESISLMPIYRLRNPNQQMVSVTIDYTLTQGGQQLGSSQMELVYIPAGKTVSQRDTMLVEYMALVASEAAASKGTKSMPEILQVILPLWKGMNGKEPAKLPEGLWGKTQGIVSPVVADGSVNVQAEDGTGKIYFFKGLKPLEE